MKQVYQVADRRDSRALAEFLSQDGQLLLPLLELIEQAELAVDEWRPTRGWLSWRSMVMVVESGPTWSSKPDPPCES